MTEQIKETLCHVTGDVLEKLAFIFSFPEEGSEETDYGSSVAASVSFAGPFTGTLIMAVSNDTLPELTGNMLGLDDNESTTVEQQHDALKELINVVCGNLLPVISGRQSIFNVNAPQIITENIASYLQSLSEENGAAAPFAAKLSLDGGECDILLFIKGKFPPEDMGGEVRSEK